MGRAGAALRPPAGFRQQRSGGERTFKVRGLGSEDGREKSRSIRLTGLFAGLVSPPEIHPTQFFSMPEVQVKKGEPVDRALKRLKTKLETEGILDEVRRLRAFETPKERSRRKARAAAKRGKVRFRFSMRPAPGAEKPEQGVAEAAAR